MEKLKLLYWRPRPLTLLSKEEQKQIRRNLREYSKDFDEEDRIADDKEKGAIVEQRRSLFDEWLSWRAQETEDLREERLAAGLPEDPTDNVDANGKGEPAKVVEEIVEEIVDESEQVMG